MPIDPPEPRDDDEIEDSRPDNAGRGVSSDDPAEGADDVNPPDDGSPQG